MAEPTYKNSNALPETAGKTNGIIQSTGESLKDLGKTSTSSEDTMGWKGSPWGEGSAFFNIPEGLENEDSFTWCTMTAFPNQQKASLGRLQAKQDPKGSSTLATFKFIMPDKFDVTLANEWENFDSPISRASQKFVDTMNGLQGVGQLTKGVLENLENINDKINNTMNGKAMEEAMKAYEVLASQSKASYKLDDAYIYKGSSRSSLNLNFLLGITGSPWGGQSANGNSGKSDVQSNTSGKKSSQSNLVEKLYKSVVLPVKSLQWCSVARAKDMFGLEYPAIFRLEIAGANKSFFKMENAILKNVQATWNSPWIGGVPFSCDLNLTFDDLLPTYKQTFTGWD